MAVKFLLGERTLRSGDGTTTTTSNNTVIVYIAGGCGGAVFILLTAVIVLVIILKKRPRKSETSRGEPRRTNDEEFEEHVNVFYGRAGDAAQVGTTPRRNVLAHDGSDQTVTQDNECVRIDSEAPPIPRAAHWHESSAAGRTRQKEEAQLEFVDGDVYSVVDKERRQNAVAEDRCGNGNASADRHRQKRPAQAQLGVPEEEYSCLHRTRTKKVPAPKPIVDAEVYGAVDKSKSLRGPAGAAGARKDKEKTADVLHSNGLEGACAGAPASDDDSEFVMFDNPCFREGDYDVDPSGDIYINLDERVKFATHGSDSGRQTDTLSLKPTGSRKASRENSETRPDG